MQTEPIEKLLNEIEEILDDANDVVLKLYSVPMQNLTYEERNELRNALASIKGTVWFHRSELNRAREAKKRYQFWK